jgi:hypothetical protein
MASRVTVQTNATNGADAAHQAEQQLAQLAKALETLQRAPISESTRNQLSSLSMGISGLHAQRVLERALDELGAVPGKRVDTDPLSVDHGVVVLFRVADNDDSRGANRPEYKQLIDRFMRSHRGIEISASDRPWGTGDSFTITGTKTARTKFLSDARWPKLQEALSDIYLAEHLPGYPSDRPKRQIKDTMKHVFGS